MVPIGPVFSGTSCRTFALIASEKNDFIYLFLSMHFKLKYIPNGCH